MWLETPTCRAVTSKVRRRKADNKKEIDNDRLLLCLYAIAAQAAAKLRRHGLLASGCNIYAQIFAAGGGGDFVERTVVFPAPTDATNEMLRAFRPEVAALFTPGLRYRKTDGGLNRSNTCH